MNCGISFSATVIQFTLTFAMPFELKKYEDMEYLA